MHMDAEMQHWFPQVLVSLSDAHGIEGVAQQRFFFFFFYFPGMGK